MTSCSDRAAYAPCNQARLRHHCRRIRRCLRRSHCQPGPRLALLLQELSHGNPWQALVKLTRAVEYCLAELETPSRSVTLLLASGLVLGQLTH